MRYLTKAHEQLHLEAKLSKANVKTMTKKEAIEVAKRDYRKFRPRPQRLSRRDVEELNKLRKKAMNLLKLISDLPD